MEINKEYYKLLEDIGNLTLHGLDAGTYVLIGNYSGDHNFIPATDSTFLTVKPALNNVAISCISLVCNS